jgi:hypothetical protein
MVQYLSETKSGGESEGKSVPVFLFHLFFFKDCAKFVCE